MTEGQARGIDGEKTWEQQHNAAASSSYVKSGLLDCKKTLRTMTSIKPADRAETLDDC